MQEPPEEKDNMNGENTAEKQVELAGGCDPHTRHVHYFGERSRHHV